MASIIKADNIQKVSDGSNIIKKCGSTITLGSCGATIALACGATQTGFGRTGTVDWCTTAKTAPFTGVSGNGYFVNTTCGAVTVTLPATPTAGDIISIADYASTFQTNNVTLCNNSSKINGECATASLSTQGQSITLVYVDGTRGWKNTMDSTSDITGAPNYIVATGGTISCCGDYKIHTFTSDGCFAVTNVGTPAGSTTVDYLVVAGGAGGGGNPGGGGGGAGGYREGFNPGSYTASPLATTALPVSVTTYPITVGGGGSLGIIQVSGGNGSDSSFSTITSTGGGGGAADNTPNNAKTGGSGGGGAFRSPGPYTVGAAGNTPPVSPSQGNPGGNSTTSTSNPDRAGGGGGAGAAGGTVGCGPSGGPGGAGATTSISGSPTTYAGGGGGGKDEDAPNGGTSGDGGSGGGGRGASSDSANSRAGQNGTANTGGGGGGAGGAPYPSGYAGGSGIVIIRYKFQ
jgi:hypothetical protein